ncbi:MAG: phage tape measure protein [Rhodospirillaceae bacterium]|nr:MAG: phage tape measure protein [Rhodospirillaceae bacterium]
MADSTSESTETIRIVVDARGAKSGSAEVRRGLREVKTEAEATNASLSRMERALGAVGGQIRSLAAVAGAALGIRAIVQAADAYTGLTNQLRVAGLAGDDLTKVQDRLFAAANRNGAQISAVTQLYSRGAMAAGDLGATQEKLLQFVDGVTAGLKVQGGSAEASSGALLQLSQALGGGIVRAEEFNSVLEGAFPIAQAAARGIDGMNGSVSKLRTAVADGKVTSAVFFDGLLKGFKQTEQQAAGMNMTIAGATTTLGNSWIRLVGSVDRATGASSGLAKAITGVASMLDLARGAADKFAASIGGIAEGTVIAGTALAVAFAPAALSAMATGFGVLGAAGIAAVRGITAAMMANPIGALAVAITGAVAAAYYFRDEIQKAIGVDVVGVAKTAANFVINSFVAAYEDIKLAWSRLPTALGDVAISAANAVIGAVEDMVNGAAKRIDVLIEKANKVNPFKPIPTIGSVKFDRLENPYEGSADNYLRDREAMLRRVYGSDPTGAVGDSVRRAFNRPDPPPLGGPTGGGGGPPPNKGAEDAQKKYEKLKDQLELTARAQDQMTAAARAGDVAFEEQKVTLEAQQKILDIFGVTVGRGNEKLEELRKLLLSISQGKAAEAFNVATTELEKQNEVLEVQNRMMGQAPELIAQEIAMIKVRQDVEKAGGKLSQEEIDRRFKAVEVGELLKAQGEELKRASEMWLEPLKSGLQSIQASAADMWENILQNGKFSMEEFGQLFIKTARRAAAELLALSTIRPVIGMGVEALGSIGLVSPGTASALGYGGSSGGGGSGGLSSMGGGGLGNLFGGSSGFFSRPIASLFPSATPSGGFASVGDLLASGQTGASAAQSGIGGLGGISIGQGLGALGGFGMGAYQLFSANGNTGKTIGGIGSMIGAAVSLIPGVGQIAGPIISILSSIVPSLFGESNTRTHSSTNANLRYGNGSWYTTGGAYGPGANSSQSESQLRGLTGGIDSVFSLLGGVKDAGKVWGLDASSWTAQGKDWSYTSNATHLVDPNGNREAWRMNMGDMMDTGAAQVAIRSILGGAVGEISTTMTGALKAMSAASMGIKETAESIVFVDEVYERLGKGALTVRTQFRELEKQFGDMTDTAKKLGLSLAPVEAEQKKATERLGQDYVDSLIDPIAAGLRAWEDEKKSILANIDYISQHTDVVVDAARINEALLRKEAALKEQLYGGSIALLEDAIARLTPGGNLANLDPSGTMAGLQASYQATYAQAAAGDAAAIGRFGAESTAYAEYARGFYAGSPEYNAIRNQIVEALQTVQASVVGPVAPSGDAANSASNPNGAQMQQLMATINNLVSELQAERAESAKLRAVLSRHVTTQAA